MPYGSSEREIHTQPMVPTALTIFGEISLGAMDMSLSVSLQDFVDETDRPHFRGRSFVWTCVSASSFVKYIHMKQQRVNHGTRRKTHTWDNHGTTTGQTTVTIAFNHMNIATV